MEFDLNSAPEQEAIEAPAEPARRRRGRPPGGGKAPGSGRMPAAARDDVSADGLRRFIGADPVRTLKSICRGEKQRVRGPDGGRTWRYPSLSERMTAATRLLGKVLPELERSEIDAAVVGAALGVDGDLEDKKELARKLIFILRSGTQTQPREAITIDAESSAADKVSDGQTVRNATLSNEIGVTSDGVYQAPANNGLTPVASSPADGSELRIGPLTVEEDDNGQWLLRNDYEFVSTHGSRADAQAAAYRTLAAEKAAPAPQMLTDPRHFVSPEEHGIGHAMPQVNYRRV